MNKITISKFLVFITGFSLLAACSRNDSSPNELFDQLSQTENETSVEAVIEKAIDQIDLEIANLERNGFTVPSSKGDDSGECRPEITVESPASGRFPMTITLNYGEGCLDKNNNFRAGQITVHLSGPYWEKNSVRQSKLSGYIFNDMKIEGSRSEINKGLNERGNYIFDIKQHEKIRNEKDEIISERDLMRVREYSRGKDLKEISDDEVWITGRAKVITQGRELTREIVKPLYRAFSCTKPFFQEGVIVTYSDKKETCRLDYGEGCDNQAVLTCKNGSSKTITLSTWVNYYSVKP